MLRKEKYQINRNMILTCQNMAASFLYTIYNLRTEMPKGKVTAYFSQGGITMNDEMDNEVNWEFHGFDARSENWLEEMRGYENDPIYWDDFRDGVSYNDMDAQDL